MKSPQTCVCEHYLQVVTKNTSIYNSVFHKYLHLFWKKMIFIILYSINTCFYFEGKWYPTEIVTNYLGLRRCISDIVNVHQVLLNPFCSEWTIFARESRRKVVRYLVLVNMYLVKRNPNYKTVSLYAVKKSKRKEWNKERKITERESEIKNEKLLTERVKQRMKNYRKREWNEEWKIINGKSKMKNEIH